MAQRVLFIVRNPASLIAQETAAKALLDARGDTVTLIATNAAVPADLSPYDVILDVVSIYSTLGSKYIGVAKGVVECSYTGWKPCWGMANATAESAGTTLVISDAAHALAGGLSGTVSILSGGTVRGYASAASAGGARQEVAHDGTATHRAIFGFEVGAEMEFGLHAPGRRVAFSTYQVDKLTADGQTLFLAAIDWAAATPACDPVAKFHATQRGLTVDFIDRSFDPDGSIASRSWDFGDSSPAVTTASPSHTYAAAGTYTVALTVTDNAGRTNTKSRSIKVGTGAVLDFFAVCGQSNALGNGVSTTGPNVPAGTAYEYTAAGGLIECNDPVGGSTTGSAWPSFVNAVYGSLGWTPVVISGMAVGGSAQSILADKGFGHWDGSFGQLYPDAIKKIDAALEVLQATYRVRYRGVLWIQGECDASKIDTASITQAQYLAAARAMMVRWRAAHGATLPLWISRIGSIASPDTTGAQAVRDAQDTWGADTYNVMGFTGANAFEAAGKMQADHLHYNQTGYNEVGAGLGAAVAAALPNLAAGSPTLGTVTQTEVQASTTDGSGGTGARSLQWQRTTRGGSTWSNVGTPDSTDLVDATVVAGSQYDYRPVWTDWYGDTAAGTTLQADVPANAATVASPRWVRGTDAGIGLGV